MHCPSCATLIESELGDIEKVTHVKASLRNNNVSVTYDFTDRGPEEIAGNLTSILRPHGYTLSLEKQNHRAKWSDFKVALPIALGFAALFVLLQKLGIVNLINADSINFGTAFVIGVIASLSTCMAVVGGLVLSMFATFAKEGDRTRPQILFHIGRLVSFFILGGAIGAIGRAFTLNTTGMFILGLVIAIIMLVLGINLLDMFHWSRRLLPATPKFITRHAIGISKLNHRLTPFLAGVATFFLPCGFTQSMQIYTLSTGSFFSGALTMLSFALGTLPVLALVSFSSFSIKNSPKAGIFWKSAGLIVIMFAVMNLINSFAVIGLIPPIFNF